MSERLLDAFREDAEHSIELPDFEELAAAGRRRRTRRHAATGAVAACVLAASGVLAAAYDGSGGPDPAEDSPDTSVATPYPELAMTTLEPGRYVIRPFAHRALPDVRFTLPAGWNAWAGPNRFEGLDALAPDDAMGHKDAIESDPAWVLGGLPLSMQWIAQPGCQMVDMTGTDVATVVRALVDVPRLRVVAEPGSTTVSGLPAVHLRLRERSPQGTCGQTTMMRGPRVGLRYLGRGSTFDVRVVDAGGRTVVLLAAWTAATPASEVDALLGVMESMEVRAR